MALLFQQQSMDTYLFGKQYNQMLALKLCQWLLRHQRGHPVYGQDRVEACLKSQPDSF